MKLSQISLSILALAAAGSVSAAGVEQIAGASASAVNAAKALKLLCSGSFTIYKTAASTNSLGNVWTATCSADFTGTSTNEVRFDTPGSLQAVLSQRDQAGATSNKVAFINPALSGTCTAIPSDGTESLSWLVVTGASPTSAWYSCGSNRQFTDVADGGFMDVEGTVFRFMNNTIPTTVDESSDYVQSNFYQAFGVGVSANLYGLLQAYQTAKGLLPASCATTSVSGGVTTYTPTNDATPTCQPSIARAQAASLFKNGPNNSKILGVKWLIGGSASTANDLPSSQKIAAAYDPSTLGATISYCRRPKISGTQASTQLYFLSNPTANGELGGQQDVAGSDLATSGSNPPVVTINHKTITSQGTGDVRNCLNNSGSFPGGNYSVGTLSLENNPIGGADTYRFVKLNGVSGSEGVAGASQASEAIAGRYDFQFRTYKFCPGGTCTPILDAIDAALPAGASSPGLFLDAEAKYTRDSATSPLVSK